MTDTEISAVAREYAEEIAQEVAVKFNPKDWACSHCEIEAQAVIKFLLRHYCLVEKSKIRQIYQAKQHILANQDIFGMTGATEAAAQKRLILCLFPEIGKEVEG